MSDSRWKPNVTVATLVEKDSQYLMVHEAPDGKPVYNQPAGHLDEGESIITAATRETLEETGWDVVVTDYLGVYRYVASNKTTYIRHGFVAKPIKHYPDQALDKGIIAAQWMSYEEILDNKPLLRGPLVQRLIDDYRAGKLYPLAALNEDG